MRVLPKVVVLLLAGALPGYGQPILEVTEEIAFDRTEAWAMQYAASASLLTGLGVPRSLEPGSVELGLEGIWVPTLSREERRVGFQGTKVEDLNKSEIFARPRVLIGLPARLSLAVSYVPPVEIFGLKPHLVALAVGRPLYEQPGWRLGLRAYGQWGTLESDFTCPAREAAAGDDPQRNPFRCEEPSNDEVTLRTATLELSAALEPGAGRLEPYAAIGITHMDLDFQVRARYNGFIDRTLLLTEGHTLYLTLGTAYRFADRWHWAAELFYSPLDVVRPPRTTQQTDALLNARAVVTYRLR